MKQHNGNTAYCRTEHWIHRCRRVGGFVLLLCALALVGTQPALAQESSETVNPICQDNSSTLAGMIEGFVQVTTGIGIMGLLVVWQADSLAEMITLDQEQKAIIKHHKRSSMKSAATLVVLGPLFSVAGSAMNIPVAQCVDLVPF